MMGGINGESQIPHYMGTIFAYLYVQDKFILGLVHGKCSHCGRLTEGKTSKEPKAIKIGEIRERAKYHTTWGQYLHIHI